MIKTGERCPNEANHTPIPDGYTPMTAHKIKTHAQARCPDCGRWVIWIPNAALARLHEVIGGGE